SKETGATYIMEGSVRTHGNTLRITAQFVDAMDDTHLWADTFRGSLDDVFEIQEKVSANIVDALLIHLTQEEKATLQKRHTANTEAYQLYLQGRFFWNKRNEEGLKTAIRFFENSIRKDPDYALAWAGLADAYNLLGEFTNLSRLELYPKAKAAVNRALELDDQLAEAHISLACIYMLNDWNWIGAEKEFMIGIELNPNYATAHHWFAECLLFLGKPEDALREITLAFDLDPVSQAIIRDQGMTYYYTRQYDKAIEKAKNALDIDRDFIAVHRLLALSYLEKRMFDKAIAENQLWGILTGNEVKTKVSLAHIYAVAGKIEEAQQLVDDVLVHHVLGENDYRGMALIYAALGETDTAFKWLDKSYERHEPSLSSLKVDPKMDPLRHDKRFDAMIKKIGLII
ncbi:MAG TPA: tetratricopeptide repeat protein, partial [Saprospiraceae bacterium]|nr:tetratricopeptide repeat protein [Saprospiraceae bacterium]